MINSLPFDFILDYLYPLEPRVQPMFGCYGIYVNEKIYFFLRNRKDHVESNGIWVALNPDYKDQLILEFPALTAVTLIGKGTKKWMMVSNKNEHFEATVRKFCELIKDGDERIGRIPDRKKIK